MATTQCRKCLLNQSTDDIYNSVMSFIAAIPKEQKTPPDEYERRLSICKTCNKLTNGMCALCGCYVEMRAAKIKQSCVNHYW